MGVFSYFQNLAAKAKTVTNSEEAKNIKNKLIKIGASMAIGGFLGAFVCFVLFVVLAFQSVNDFSNDGFSFLILIPFCLFIPCGVVGGIGAFALYLGLGIVVAKATTNFLDNNSYCPYCGDVVEEGELYCKKCGKPLLSKKICSKCDTENDMESKYCKHCGNKL